MSHIDSCDSFKKKNLDKKDKEHILILESLKNKILSTMKEQKSQTNISETEYQHSKSKWIAVYDDICNEKENIEILEIGTLYCLKYAMDEFKLTDNYRIVQATISQYCENKKHGIAEHRDPSFADLTLLYFLSKGEIYICDQEITHQFGDYLVFKGSELRHNVPIKKRNYNRISIQGFLKKK